MPDGKAGAWASLNGMEIINAERTVEYITNLGLPLEVYGDCWCPQIQDLLACTPVTAAYTYPGSDPAPWVDSSIPESTAFLGFLPVSFEGLGSTYTRASAELISGGSILGKLRAQARTLTWKGYLVGTNCCAAEFGLRWLTSALAGMGSCDDCSDSDLDVLLCCPDVVECVDCEASQGNGPVSDAFRTFHKVGLADGPHKVSERSLGCGKSCDGTALCGDCEGCLIEVEFSLIAGNPFMYKDPVVVCNDPIPACKTCAQATASASAWSKINTITYPASEEDAASCKNKLECLASPADCNEDPNCPVATLPTIPEIEDPCGCEPLFITENCCHIKADDTYGQFFNGTPQIELFSGDKPLNNVVVRFYENPQKRDCTDPDLFDICNLCDYLTVRYVPANSTLSIDGLTKRVSITCPGDNVQPGESLVVSPFKWPTLKCIDYIVKVSADCCAKPPITFVKSSSKGVYPAKDFIATAPVAQQVLHVKSTVGFPSTGTITIEKTKGVTAFKLSYTGTTATSFTGVIADNPNATVALATGNRVVGVSTDTDCTQGVSTSATSKVTILPFEM